MVFYYDGQDRSEVPDETIHAVVHPLNSWRTAIRQNDHYSAARLVSGAFVECPNLQSVVLPEGLKQIGQNAFYNCPVLTTVLFPTSLEEIHDNAFSLCFQLTNLVWPASLKRIGENAFFECSKLKSLNLSACLSLQVISDCAFQRCIRVARVTLPNGHRLVTIEKQAFSSCTSLQQIVIPDSVEFIGEQAFADCSCLASVQLSQSLEAIKEATFFGCDSLLDVTIPPDVSILEMDAFAHCERLERVRFQNGSKLAILGDSAFLSCHSLKHLCAPSNLLRIGDTCFANCDSLVSAELPRCLEQVGEEAFSNCTALRNIYFWHSSVHFEGPCLNNCTLLEQACQDGLFNGDRFGGLPFHKMAYEAVYDEENTDHGLEENHGETPSGVVDMFGMTPFHILALSEDPNQRVFEYLLQTLPNNSSSDLLCHKDCFGFTPLELLCTHINFNESKAKVLLNHCIEVTAVERIRWLGLAAWRMVLFHFIDDLFDGQEQQMILPSRRLYDDDELGQAEIGLLTSASALIRVHKLHCLFDELSKYELLEATSLLELALWKMQLVLPVDDSFDDHDTTNYKASGEDDDNDDTLLLELSSLRLTSRVNCKADIVLPNVLLFLI